MAYLLIFMDDKQSLLWLLYLPEHGGLNTHTHKKNSQEKKKQVCLCKSFRNSWKLWKPVAFIVYAFTPIYKILYITMLSLSIKP